MVSTQSRVLVFDTSAALWFNRVMSKGLQRDLAGQTFGRLTVLNFNHRDNRRSAHWKCVCTCGAERVVRGENLTNGKTVSCGCFNRDQAIALCKARAGQRAPVHDLLDHRFSRLTVVARDPDEKRSSWICQCDCGGKRTVRTSDLTQGVVESCGCLFRERQREAVIHHNQTYDFQRASTHGMAGEPEYTNWSSMIQRCYNPNAVGFEKYHKLGVCEFLRSTPVNLVTLLGRKPTLKHTIDRISNEFGYHCGACAECATNQWRLNVRWATMKEQLRNTTRNVFYTIDGVTRCASEWAERMSITPGQFRYRYRANIVPDKDALQLPIE